MKLLLGRLFSFLLLCTACATTTTHAMFLSSAQALIPVERKDEDACARLHGFSSPDQHLFMVCDGHSIGRHPNSEMLRGVDAANFVIAQLPELLKKELASETLSSEEALKRAVTQTETNMAEFVLAGTTLSLIFIDGKTCHIGNIGDSRVVLAYDGCALQPIVDHTLDNVGETTRLNNTKTFSPLIRACISHEQDNCSYASDWVCPDTNKDCRLLKTVPIGFTLDEQDAVARVRFTRSLGDTYLKKNEHKLLIADAEFAQFPITSSLAFAIIASDGVFETEVDEPISNQEAVEIVASALAGPTGGDHAAFHAANALAKTAQLRVGHDDIAVVIIIFNQAS